ncbi:chitin-binding domain-containing protein [Maritimibacter sp. HL-12]|jgi:hypothetical protein|uniref:chitin-binding domain-containing protein n=1 Tax=Maritimibacter sp. HL-12 TaxID=1162418 RepID=UPI000A0F19EF|nr:chitin-binding domain-containing protein [Maritimibacter sp. HL-12]SMH29644.1 Chitin binding Peritrophin-A domain-containing protein [Maritimibacter sp. HL-12]
MKATKFLTAAFFALMPAAGFAMCSDHKESANVCATGLSWDEEKQACVEIVSS